LLRDKVIISHEFITKNATRTNFNLQTESIITVNAIHLLSSSVLTKLMALIPVLRKEIEYLLKRQSTTKPSAQ